jgi:3-methyladenine DNA glycosylase AlkD
MPKTSPIGKRAPRRTPLPTLSAVRAAVRAHIEPERAKSNVWFFKTGPGDYGERDRFLGITAPSLRALARRFGDLPHERTLSLLRSRWHEERLLALLILVRAYERGTKADRVRIHRAYLANTDSINNWDLVDVSAAQILGAFAAARGSIAVLRRLAKSKSLWERRMAMIATLHFIRKGDVAPAIEIAGGLVNDRHDLIHKAVGWMLREAGSRDLAAEEAFLAKHCRTMPRTALRYAIEKFPEARRKRYLRGDI